MVAKRTRTEQDELTLDEVLDSGVLDGLVTSDAPVKLMGPAGKGGTWFKDTLTDTCYRLERLDDGKLKVAGQTELKQAIPERAKRIVVKCECGAEREIATQDAFQVKRCVECQKKHRNSKRNTRARSRRMLARQARELAKVNGEDETKKEEDTR